MALGQFSRELRSPAPWWLTAEQAALVHDVEPDTLPRDRTDDELASLLRAGSWYRIDWPDEAQELVEALARRRVRKLTLTAAQRAEAEAAIPGEYVYQRVAVDALASAFSVPIRRPICAREQMGLRDWPQASAVCAERARWTRMMERASPALPPSPRPGV